MATRASINVTLPTAHDNSLRQRRSRRAGTTQGRFARAPTPITISHPRRNATENPGDRPNIPRRRPSTRLQMIRPRGPPIPRGFFNPVAETLEGMPERPGHLHDLEMPFCLRPESHVNQRDDGDVLDRHLDQQRARSRREARKKGLHRNFGGRVQTAWNERWKTYLCTTAYVLEVHAWCEWTKGAFDFVKVRLSWLVAWLFGWGSLKYPGAVMILILWACVPFFLFVWGWFVFAAMLAVVIVKIRNVLRDVVWWWRFHLGDEEKYQFVIMLGMSAGVWWFVTSVDWEEVARRVWFGPRAEDMGFSWR